MPSSPIAAALPATAEGGGQDGVEGPVRHVRRGVGWAVVAAVSVYAVLVTGVLPGVVNAALLVVVLLVLPTAPLLARRVAVNGSLLIGWAPVLWWVRWPVPVDHAALLMAVSTGWIGWVVTSGNPRAELRRLVPGLKPSDRWVPLAGVLALAAMARWAFAASSQRALEVLAPGIDNVAHFYMFATIRSYGATTQALGVAPDGTRWGFDEYPQGFHALVATVSELMHAKAPSGADLLVAYTQGVAAVIALGLVVVTAAVVSLPPLRSRPWVALPVVVVTWAAFLWNPGQNLLADGFGNFWLAAAAAGTALVLSLSPQDRLAVPETAAVGGLLVAVAHDWALLIVLALPAALALLVPLGRTFRDRRARPRLWLTLGVLAVAAVGVLQAARTILSSVSVASVVQATGGIHGNSPLPAFALLGAGLYACLAAPGQLRRLGVAESDVLVAVRARVLALSLVAGMLVSAALFVAQLHTLGTSSYYFLKFFMGLELVAAILVPAVIGLLVASRPSRTWRAGSGAAVTVVLTLLASQFCGAFPRLPAALWDAQRSGTASLGGRYSSEHLAAGVVSAVAGTSSEDSFTRDYLAIGGEGASRAFYPDAWYHAVLASGSAGGSGRLDALRVRVSSVDTAAPLVRRLLEADPGLRIVVAPRHLDPLRGLVGSPQLAARVVTWRSPARGSIEAE